MAPHSSTPFRRGGLAFLCAMLFAGLLASSGPAWPATTPDRLALVIGNSRYDALGTLANAAGDARAMADALAALGYQARLVIDADELTLRREIRDFAGASAGADIALVYYAGHGAQIGGSNYLLPTDMGILERETDILLTGLKVDDLVNSLMATTKILFLDACRDNPALVQNLVSGRGGAGRGLAPANGGTLLPPEAGGGVFIAYATDSGAIALDGSGEHSHFATALLTHLHAPVSIDDMFALVTRDVRAATANEQRPYKYASLESIVCLAGPCGTVTQTGAMTVAVTTNNDDLRRTHDEWTIFEMHGNAPQYIRLSSIAQHGTRFSADIRSAWINGEGTEPLPEGTHWIAKTVTNCDARRGTVAEQTIHAADGSALFRDIFGEPQFITLINDIAPDNDFFGEWVLLCGNAVALPLHAHGEAWGPDYRTLMTLRETGRRSGTVWQAPIKRERPPFSSPLPSMRPTRRCRSWSARTCGTRFPWPPPMRARSGAGLLQACL